MSSSNENELPYNQAVRVAGLIHKMREKQPLQEAEQQELEHWLNSSESNKKLFEFLHNREQLAAALEALMQYDENKVVADIFKALGERSPPGVKRRMMMIRRWSVAASLLLLIGVAAWFFMLRSGAEPVAYNTITTPRGAQQRLALADGSEVWLNAASSITYPANFTGNTREVTITGEAYFNVAKDNSKPFIVTAGALKIQVAGTEFDVMAYGDEDAIRTTLVNGVVKVSNQQSAIGNRQSAILKPGQQAVLTADSGLTIHDKTDADLDAVTAWRSGQFRFHETDMAAIMRQIARWYNVKIEYRGSVANIGFSGQISRKKHVKELLDILSDTRKVHFEIAADTTIVVIPGPK